MLGTFTVHAGDFKKGSEHQYLAGKLTMKVSGQFFREIIPDSEIAEIEADAAASQGNDVTFSCKLNDGRKFLATAPSKVYTELLASQFGKEDTANSTNDPQESPWDISSESDDTDSQVSHRQVGIPLVIGIAVMPYIFSFFLLRKGHTDFARAFGFGWLFLYLIVPFAGQDRSGGQDRAETKQVQARVAGGTPDQKAAASSNIYYVTAERLNVRLSPSPSGIVTNALDRGQQVNVEQVNAGWARISKYYDGGVEGVDGQVARWVSMDYLSKSRPKNETRVPAQSGALEKALSKSDDYQKYRPRFAEAAKKLIAQGKCSVGDFKENGGWVRSMSHKPKPVYFMYCGGASIANRLYVNAVTGEIFR